VASTHWKATQRKYPELRNLPEFIAGANGGLVPLLDATLADLRAEEMVLERRIARAERRERRRRNRGFHGE
jgi:hypothetical protein